MIKLVSEITIKGEQTWQFNSVSNVVITEDIATLTDTCELQLPRKIKWKDAIIENRKLPIKRGDKVIVKLGYDEDLKVRFSGYIKKIDIGTPITIKCEDDMFMLKTLKTKPKTFTNAMLDDIIKHLLSNTDDKDSTIEYRLIDKDVKIGSWRISKNTVAEELQELKEKYMLSSYFRFINGKGVLYVGMTYPFDNRKKVKIRPAINLINENFEYKNADEIKARVEATSFNKKHKKIEVKIGDKEGELIKMHLNGLEEEDLKKHAERTLENYKNKGIKGDFETFGKPEITKCDIIDLETIEGYKGRFLVKKNEISFGMNGFRQKVELGQIID